ncbi:hypothetical protein Q5Y75_26970 [Ruegeria sp. 2205SS24-7]|uniref:hypothetical protein n=1 Tax=Ruegeria discodermiae TaxID=3064389 RepID=UPI002740CA63|nr:hypothetical protein [Ruegeria sp. 2205SS24-7]MDP5220834.1 hypothetical protein [Ruegeria sp. 2205SS24-7]
MSGFFDRIVRQAAGPGQVHLRSSLQLPFADVPVDTATRPEPAAALPAQTASGHVFAPQTADTNMPEDAPAEQASRAPEQTTTPPSLVSQAEPRTGNRFEPPTRMDVLVPEHATQAPTLTEAVNRAAPAEAPAPAITAPRRNSDSAQPASAPEPAQNALQQELRQSPEAPRTGDFPEPLVPQAVEASSETFAVRTDPSPISMSSQSVPPQQTRRHPQDPEVHVHIGRVEVTSVADPAPAPAPRRARRTPQLSLEAYLAKRSGVAP